MRLTDLVGVSGGLLVGGLVILAVALLFVHNRSRLVAMLVVGTVMLVSALLLMLRLLGPL
jgi:hypothetical protein